MRKDPLPTDGVGVGPPPPRTMLSLSFTLEVEAPTSSAGVGSRKLTLRWDVCSWSPPPTLTGVRRAAAAAAADSICAAGGICEPFGVPERPRSGGPLRGGEGVVVLRGLPPPPPPPPLPTTAVVVVDPPRLVSANGWAPAIGPLFGDELRLPFVVFVLGCSGGIGDGDRTVAKEARPSSADLCCCCCCC